MWWRTHKGSSGTSTGAIPCAWGKARTAKQEEELKTDMGTCWTRGLCSHPLKNSDERLAAVMRRCLPVSWTGRGWMVSVRPGPFLPVGDLPCQSAVVRVPSSGAPGQGATWEVTWGLGFNRESNRGCTVAWRCLCGGVGTGA